MPQNSQTLNIYKLVTDRIIASLEKGVVPWEKPWKAPRYKGGAFPRNFQTGRPYRGVNVMLLWSAEHSSPFWVTFKQAQELGGSVRKGERSTPIVSTNNCHRKKNPLPSKKRLIAPTPALF